MNSQAVYEGQRAVDPNKRVFILTRSAFAGMQRYAAATWSGDVSSDWDSLRKQVPAGLTCRSPASRGGRSDVGGFAVPRHWSRREPASRGRRGLARALTRWFQIRHLLSAVPRPRKAPYREMWIFGADEGHRAYKTQLAFDRLRYRMLPYTYSVAAAVTHRDAALMRPLVMDFRDDPEVLASPTSSCSGHRCW